MIDQSTVQRAVLATDGSAHSLAAASFAGALAWSTDAAISIASVVEAPNPSDLPISKWEEKALADWRQIVEYVHTTERDEAQRSIDEAASALRARHPDLHIDEVMCFGQPAAELLALARETKSELIIAGARGRTVLEGLLLGSVSEALVTEAPCPVLIVRDAISELRVVVVVLRTVEDADRLAEACLRLPLPATTRVTAITAGAPRPHGDSTRRFTDEKMEALLADWDEAEQAETTAAGKRFIERMHAGDPERSVTTRVVHGVAAIRVRITGRCCSSVAGGGRSAQGRSHHCRRQGTPRIRRQTGSRKRLAQAGTTCIDGGTRRKGRRTGVNRQRQATPSALIM